MDNKRDFLDNYFDNSQNRQKIINKIKKSIPGNIQDGVYTPHRPYCLKKGIGENKTFKGKTFEWFLIHYHKRFIGLKKWAEETLKPEILYREHIIWVSEAFQKLPRPQCIVTNCTKQATFFSIRSSADGQISFGFPYVACEDHIEELKSGDDRISIEPLSPISVNIFQHDKDRKIFFNFLKIIFNFKNLSGQQIFKILKKYLPTIKIQPPPEVLSIKNTKDLKSKKKVDPIQYELGF